MAALVAGYVPMTAQAAFAADSKPLLTGATATAIFGLPSGWTNQPITFRFQPQGDTPPFTTFYQLGAGELTTFTAPVDFGTEGTTELTFFSRNALGQSEDAHTRTIRIDLTDPISSHEAQALYTDGTAEISLAGSDALSYGGLSWMVDNGAITTTDAASVDLVLTELGTHTLTYWSFDLAGNRSVETPVTFVLKNATALGLTSSAATLDEYGDRYIVAGALTSEGAGVPGQALVLQTSSDNRTFSDTALGAVTGADGAFSISARPRSKTYYRVRFATTGAYLGAVSSAIAIVPRAKVSNPVAPSIMYRFSSRTVYGYLWPRHTSGSTSAVRLYRYRRVNGAWKPYGYVKVSVRNYSDHSKYSASLRLPYTGRWRLRAYAPADSAHAATWSSGYDYVTVR